MPSHYGRRNMSRRRGTSSRMGRTHSHSMGRARRTYQMGGRTSCPPGTHMMPDGTCMEGAYHGAPSSGGGYRRGGNTRRYAHGGRNNGCGPGEMCHGGSHNGMRRGGRTRRRYHSGGKLHNWAHGMGYRHPGEIYFQHGGHNSSDSSRKHLKRDSKGRSK